MQPGLFTDKVVGDTIEYTSRLTNRTYTLSRSDDEYKVETPCLLLITDSRQRALQLIEMADTLD